MLVVQANGVPVPVWPRAAIHDSVAAIVKQAAYRRDISTTLLDRIIGWFRDFLGRILDGIGGVPHGQLVATIAAGVVALLIVARLVYAARLRAAEVQEGGRRGVIGTSTRDPWHEAELLAGAGQFTEAAHALYRGTIGYLAASGVVRLHTSKTSGDYARELRRRGAPAYAPFRRFGALYDRIIYGAGTCSAPEYATLLDAARAVFMRGSERAA